MNYRRPTSEELEHEHKYFKYQLLWAFFRPIVIGWGLYALIVWLAGK